MTTALGLHEIAGGPKSVAELGRRLGVPVSRAQGLGDGKIRLTVACGAGTANLILIPAPAEHYFLRAGEIDVCYEGKEASKDLVALIEGLAPKLDGLATGDLVRVIEDDPGSARGRPQGDPDAAGASGGEDGDPDSQGISDRLGGNPGQWRRFFCDREFGRVAFWGGSSGFKGRVLYFVHADYDCSFMPPDVTFRGMTFLNYPPVHPHSSDTPSMDMQYQHWTSELKDKEVVLGTDHRLDALMDEIRETVKPDLIMIQWSCVPTVIGDDMERLALRAKEAGGCPVLTNTIQKRLEENGDYSPFEELFHQLMQDPRFRETPRDPRALNLVDCPPHFFDDELGPILDSVGLRVNERVFPAVDLKGMRNYLNADCQVMPEYFKGVKTVERSLGSLPLDSIYAPAPFGLRGACEYARVIGERFGMAREVLARHMDHWDGRKGEWDRLTAEAARYRLAFVADEGSVPQLLDRKFLTGIPVVEMVAEMGFDAEFVLFAPGGRAPARAGELAKLSWFRNPPRVRTFSDAEGLDAALSESESRAVYSDVFFDSRITKAGKAQFSMRTCEAGIDGALRTLERLLGICRLPFYEKYKRHLRKVHA